MTNLTSPPRRFNWYSRLIASVTGFYGVFGWIFLAASSFFALFYVFSSPIMDLMMGNMNDDWYRGQSISGWIVIVFILLGIYVIVKSWRKNRKAIYLLREGQITGGKEFSKIKTKKVIEINEEEFPIYKYEFEFFVEDERYLCTFETHKIEEIEDEVNEVILYHPKHPSINTLLDSIPFYIKINKDGTLEQSDWSDAKFLIAPFLALVFLSPYILVLFFRSLIFGMDLLMSLMK